ncbi:MAG: DUF1934 family protein [Clostridiales bacterium]|nr:DUF1934 family protein [Clostridiales bacterium]
MTERVQLRLRFELDGQVRQGLYEAVLQRRGGLCAAEYTEEDGTSVRIVFSRAAVSVTRKGKELQAFYRFEADRQTVCRIETGCGPLTLPVFTQVCQAEPERLHAQVQYLVLQGDEAPVQGRFSAVLSEASEAEKEKSV